MTRMFACKWLGVLVGLLFLAPGAASAQDHPIPPSSGMPVERFTTVFGQKIAYYDMSNGPVLVLVHGLSTSATIDWGQVYKPFAEKYRVIALDNVGFGDSDKPPIEYSMQTYVDFLAEFLRQLNIKRFYLSGESLGGGIAGLYAMEAAQPDSTLPKVEKLILNDAAVPVPPTPTDIEREKNPSPLRGAGLAPATPAEYKKRVNSGLFVNDNYATDAYAEDVWRLLLRYNYHPPQGLPSVLAQSPLSQWTIEHTRDVKVPTLIVWGQQDHTIPVDHAEYLHKQIAGSQLWVLPDAGHAPGMEKPNLYVQKVNEFLEK